MPSATPAPQSKTQKCRQGSSCHPGLPSSLPRRRPEVPSRPERPQLTSGTSGWADQPKCSWNSASFHSSQFRRRWGGLPPTVGSMHATLVPSSTLLDLASAQDGVLSCRQVLDLGGSNTMIRRFVRDGRWHRIASGILSTNSSTDWLGLVWAGVLLGGSSAVVGGPAAAHLHEIAPQPEVIDIWAPDNAPRSRHPWQFHRDRRSGRGEPTRVSLEQAVLDVCSTGDSDDIAATLATALSKRRTTAAAVRALVEPQQHLRHRKLILAMLADVGAGAESALEVRYLRDVERAHGLPVGQRQVGVSAHTRTDVGYVELMCWWSSMGGWATMGPASGETGHATTTIRLPAASSLCATAGTTWCAAHARLQGRLPRCSSRMAGPDYRDGAEAAAPYTRTDQAQSEEHLGGQTSRDVRRVPGRGQKGTSSTLCSASPGRAEDQ